MNIVVMILGLVLVGTATVVGMFVHGILDRKKIAHNIRGFSTRIGGETRQDGLLSYPRLDGEINGRKVSVFFQSARVGRTTLLYLLFTTSIDISFSILFFKENFFRPLIDEEQLQREVGKVVDGVDPRYQVRSKEETKVRQLFQKGLSRNLDPLEDFTSVVIGPDSIIIGKPYDGLADTDPSRIGRNFEALQKIAEAVEEIPSS